MDAFEELVAEILYSEGYWVQTSVKVKLTREEKVLVGRHSTPRWELDVVAYKPSTNELLVVECKSFLDSTGVQLSELQDGHASRRYKLFREPVLRQTVLKRLAIDFFADGRCLANPSLQLAMAAGKIKRGDEAGLEAHFATQGWKLFGPKWLCEKLQRAAIGSYENRISAVVAKLLLRPQQPAAIERISSDQRLRLLVTENPKRSGSAAYERFEGYFRPEASTLAGALECGVRMDDIRNDLKKGYIEFEPQEGR